MGRKTNRKKRRTNSGIEILGKALDFMIAGHDAVVGPDFLMTRRDLYNDDIGYLHSELLETYDQEFIDSLFNIIPEEKIDLPSLSDLAVLYPEYREKRDQLNKYQQSFSGHVFKYDIASAKELGNYDVFHKKVVIGNEAEMNIFSDYIFLYRKLNNKRAIIQWRLDDPKKCNTINKEVVLAHEKSRFAVLRLDQNLEHGAIKVTNIITKTEHLLIDKALNRSSLEGCFFICSVLDMGKYSMTSGGGIPIKATASLGKSALTVLKKHLEKVRLSKREFNNNIINCVKEIYGFCLRAGILEYVTASP